MNKPTNYNIAIIGATAAGTSAAVTAARMGEDTILIDEIDRPGGMCSNGVSVSDIRSLDASGGFFEEFRLKVAARYGFGDGLRYEPKVADEIIRAMIVAESRLRFAAYHRVESATRRDGVWTLELRHTITGEPSAIHARVLIDATAEADVAASVGVRFRIPREARSTEEPHAGHIYYDNLYDQILPGSTGEADHRIQSYAYLLVVRDYGTGDHTIARPDHYDPDDYRHSPPWEESWAYLYAALPNDKYELNQHPWGGDLPGINYNYPTATPDERASIVGLYRDRALGYLYYLQTELGKRSIGLPEDEYPESEHIPPVLYVREARRMIGLATMTEADVTRGTAEQSIAIGDYPMDSHATQPLDDPTAKHRGEGEFWLVRHTPVYQVPLGVILPDGVPGLIVPTAVSATHVAYGTLRMEPVRMAMGQAAGIVAALAVGRKADPTDVPYQTLREVLLSQGAKLGCR